MPLRWLSPPKDPLDRLLGPDDRRTTLNTLLQPLDALPLNQENIMCFKPVLQALKGYFPECSLSLPLLYPSEVHNNVFLPLSVQLNEDFKKLLPHPKASKLSMKIQMKDDLKLEKTMQDLQVTQSFIGWFLDGVSKEISLILHS